MRVRKHTTAELVLQPINTFRIRALGIMFFLCGLFTMLIEADTRALVCTRDGGLPSSCTLHFRYWGMSVRQVAFARLDGASMVSPSGDTPPKYARSLGDPGSVYRAAPSPDPLPRNPRSRRSRARSPRPERSHGEPSCMVPS